jgi:hypothetical protein
MLEQRAAGWGYTRIAEHHGITKARVGQILGQHKTRALVEALEEDRATKQ